MSCKISKVFLAGLTAVVFLTFAGVSVSAEPVKVWEVSGFMGPESAIYDARRDMIYVSNVAGQPSEKNGQGFISTLTP